jgi:hypothetical protein
MDRRARPLPCSLLALLLLTSAVCCELYAQSTPRREQQLDPADVLAELLSEEMLGRALELLGSDEGREMLRQAAADDSWGDEGDGAEGPAAGAEASSPDGGFYDDAYADEQEGQEAHEAHEADTAGGRRLQQQSSGTASANQPAVFGGARLPSGCRSADAQCQSLCSHMLKAWAVKVQTLNCPPVLTPQTMPSPLTASISGLAALWRTCPSRCLLPSGCHAVFDLLPLQRCTRTRPPHIALTALLPQVYSVVGTSLFQNVFTNGALLLLSQTIPNSVDPLRYLTDDGRQRVRRNVVSALGSDFVDR